MIAERPRCVTVKIKTISFVLLAALISGVAGAAPQFVRKDTWLESVLASRAAFADDVDREPVWELTTQFFPDQLSCRECRIEQRYGLWGKEAGQEDWPTMAMRYARGVGKASPKTHDLVVNCKGLDDLRVIRDLFYAARAESRLALAEKTLEFVERSAPRPQFNSAPISSSVSVPALPNTRSAPDMTSIDGKALLIK